VLEDVAELGAQVLDGIGPQRAGTARNGDVELARVEEELDAVAGLEVTDLPDPVELFLLVLVIVLLVLGDQRSRRETGGGRERECERGETESGNAVLRGECRADQPPRAACTAEPSAV
jgi:hypothetical protein